MKRHGVVLAFLGHVPKAQIERIVQKLYDEGMVEGNLHYEGRNYSSAKMGAPIVHEYDTRVGGPVWYIP
jgi:hypothetical protein